MTLYAVGFVILAVIAGVWALVRRIKKGARAEVAAEVAVETVEVVRDMAQAQADAPQGKTETVKRLREKGL